MSRNGLAIALLIALAILPDSLKAQTAAARPERGIGPVGSYAVSDFESVSLTNGNVNVSLPLAGLPPLAGGKLSWTLRAVYNSKQWDAVRSERQTDPLDTSTKHVISNLQLSGVSGWRIGGGYSIRYRDADWDYEYMTPSQTDPQYSLITDNRWRKVVLETPDGAEHELRPVDYVSFNDVLNNHNYLRGYFKDTPNNVGASMRYYSFDGSFLWVKIDPDPTPVPYFAQSWTLYLPDGTKVEQLPSGVQRIADTNGNRIKIWGEVAGSISTTHYQDELTGREIKYTYDATGNGGQGLGQVQYQTVGGVWVTVDINFGVTRIHGKRYEFGDPVCADAANYVDTWITVVRSIVLPQTEPGQPRRQFTFSYNSDDTVATNFEWREVCGPYQTVTSASRGWGSLSRVVTPSGATVNYSYGLDNVHYLPSNPDDAPRESMLTKTVTHDGATDTWQYGSSPVGGGVSSPDGSFVKEVMYPSDRAFAYNNAGFGGKEGLVYRTNHSNKVLVERHWTLMPFSGGNAVAPGAGVLMSFNPVVDAEYTSLIEPGEGGNPTPIKMSAKTFRHDFNGNVTEVKEYDWFDPSLVTRDAQGIPTGVPASATLLRTTGTSYHSSPATLDSPHVYAKRTLMAGTPSILNAVKETSVGESQTRFSYDGQAFGVAPTLGNVTKLSTWDNLGSQWLDTEHNYDSRGNRTSTTAPKGNVTQVFYEDATRAMPTRVVVDPQNGMGTQQTLTSYDFSTGPVLSTTDANGQTADIDYTNQLLGSVDPFGRPGVVASPAVTVGGTSQRRRAFNFYEDSQSRVRTESDLFSEGDRLLKARVTYDRLGRPVLSEQSENGSSYTVSAQTVYVQMGRVTLTSHPTRNHDGTSVDGWSRVTKDDAGRVVEVATFEGAAQPAVSGTGGNFKGKVVTNYFANETTVTDQDNKSRRSVTDAIGRLTNVFEDPAGLNYETIYTYDALGNLRRVNQGGQYRFFAFDSLGRLVRARNPEQGVTTHAEVPQLTDSLTGNSQWSLFYAYDRNGNLTTRIDARNVKTEYAYDGLNRNITVNYSDTGTINPDVTRLYDGAALGKGRLWKSYEVVSDVVER